jgi:hypothetical protein
MNQIYYYDYAKNITDAVELSSLQYGDKLQRSISSKLFMKLFCYMFKNISLMYEHG